jgi:hypothetical protein
MIEELDRPPAEAGWYPLAVMRKKRRGWDWVALMVDTDPDAPDFGRVIRQCWVRIRGRHRSHDAAQATLRSMIVSPYLH